MGMGVVIWAPLSDKITFQVANIWDKHFPNPRLFYVRVYPRSDRAENAAMFCSRYFFVIEAFDHSTDLELIQRGPMDEVRKLLFDARI